MSEKRFHSGVIHVLVQRNLDMSEEQYKDLKHIRKDYGKSVLDPGALLSNPSNQLRVWLSEAADRDVPDYNAFCLSTIDQQGTPHGRIVLVRSIEHNAIHFFTNYASEKGEDLARNSACGATFFWPQLERQVRLRGEAKHMSAADSDAYFVTRPRESQLGAWASDQSKNLGQKDLQREMESLRKHYENVESIPRPPHWGGYRFTIRQAEFWQGRPSRLHHRVRYSLRDGRFLKEALQP
jgi:pyridoxamine 5'-phosphate oxidase